jgi:hypothetical protein
MHDFNSSLAWSKTNLQYESDAAAIHDMLEGCVTVTASTVEMDKLGVDYIAALRGGANVLIDAKARRAGASKQQGWTFDDPLLAIEKWSVVPGGKYAVERGKTGWTLDESKITDMILYTFDPADSRTRFLLPFHNLRMAARRFMNQWASRFGLRTQDNGRYESQCIFVPSSEVILAMETTYTATVPCDAEEDAQLALFTF